MWITISGAGVKFHAPSTKEYTCTKLFKAEDAEHEFKYKKGEKFHLQNRKNSPKYYLVEVDGKNTIRMLISKERFEELQSNHTPMFKSSKPRLKLENLDGGVKWIDFYSRETLSILDKLLGWTDSWIGSGIFKKQMLDMVDVTKNLPAEFKKVESTYVYRAVLLPKKSFDGKHVKLEPRICSSWTTNQALAKGHGSTLWEERKSFNFKDKDKDLGLFVIRAKYKRNTCIINVMDYVKSLNIPIKHISGDGFHYMQTEWEVILKDHASYLKIPVKDIIASTELVGSR